MFIAIVQIPMTKRPRDTAVESARKTAPTYTASLSTFTPAGEVSTGPAPAQVVVFSRISVQSTLADDATSDDLLA